MSGSRRVAAISIAFASAAATIAAACGLDAVGLLPEPAAQIETGVDAPFVPPPADATDDVAESGDADAGPSMSCPTNLAGPTLVPVHVDGGDGDGGGEIAFCIDSTEVTNAHFGAFLAATDGGTSRAFLDASAYDGGLPGFCFPHTTFAPYPYSPGSPNEPVTYIDWCDAWAYCQWSGKHLCTTTDDGGTNEWRRACTHDGTRTLPYGSSAEAGACNVGNPAAGQKPVKSHPKCEGGYPGIFDMVGNGEEWVDGCDATSCQLYGGSWLYPASASCSTSAALGPRRFGDGITFRCCR